VMYLLLDLDRLGITVKNYVFALEQSILNMLQEMGIAAHRKPGAPGVYVQDKKLAALGVRIRRGCSYHGLSLNIDMDLSPYSGINPCGYEGMKVTQMSELGQTLDIQDYALSLLTHLMDELGFTHYSFRADYHHNS
ncbi:MAG: lipoyl(octanoyl) transferase LipB, partial [Gammaproteobacteria bacterium]|nr:lipoyl(octanoyl) transferase LipB [Gammaproteobacteria bacterium]